MSDTLLIALSEDAYLGDAIASVQVDNFPPSLFTVTASNAGGQSEPLEMMGAWGTGAHTVSITFTNDRWDGTAATDRNLYVKGATWNGVYLPCVAPLMSGGQSARITVPPNTGLPAPTLHITNWGNLKTSSTGDAASWSNSIPPGANRTLNGTDEQEWYCDPTAGNYNPFGTNALGQLVITAIPGLMDGKTYLSGALASNGFFNQTYGSFRFKAQTCTGPGWRPGIWLLPSSLAYTGELDLAEWWQGNTGVVHQTVHGAVAGAWITPNCTPTVTPDTSSALHEYRMDWTSAFVTFFVDGVQTGQFTTPDGLKQPCFVIINLGVGAPGSWCGNPTPGAVGTLVIGEVTVYPMS